MTALPLQVLGTWTLTISTLIGKIAVLVDLSEHDGRLVGAAQDRNTVIPLHDIATEPGPQAETTRITWRQSITKPLRLDLHFDVVVAGDTITGFSKAGRLPRSAVRGERRVTS